MLLMTRQLQSLLLRALKRAKVVGMRRFKKGLIRALEV